jgi:hypothetical protein
VCYLKLCLISALTPNRWRRLRRPAVEGFSKSVAQDFYPIQSREAIMLALALIKSPPMKKHFQRHAWSIVLTINYHLPPVESENDSVVVGIANHVLRALHEMQPGNRLVEYFPWMRYVPSRCVCRVTYRGLLIVVAYRFAKWKRDAQYSFTQESLRYERLLNKVADDLVSARFSGTQ